MSNNKIEEYESRRKIMVNIIREIIRDLWLSINFYLILNLHIFIFRFMSSVRCRYVMSCHVLSNLLSLILLYRSTSTSHRAHSSQTLTPHHLNHFASPLSHAWTISMWLPASYTKQRSLYLVPNILAPNIISLSKATQSS